MPYIFAYGSLIEHDSRITTTPQAMYVLPARAHGYLRGWWARTGAIGFTTTFVGAIECKPNSLNGIIYAVSEQELLATTDREHGYRAANITESVEILTDGSGPHDHVWMYVNDFESGQREKGLPSPEAPIVQSYVDLCLTGCFQVEEGFPDVGDFAREFITSTTGWSQYWENDRVHARRPFIAAPLDRKIDALINKELPQLFSEIQLAPGRWQ